MVRIPGGHAPNMKNRSSKHLMCLTGMRDAYRCMSNAELEALVNAVNDKSKSSCAWQAQKELNRRHKKRAKKAGLPE